MSEKKLLKVNPKELGKKPGTDENVLHLYRPRMLPVNDRIMCQLVKRDFFKTDSGIILPVGISVDATNREREKMNPLLKYYYIVVSYSRNIHKVFPLPQIYDPLTKTWQSTKLEIGDRIVMSDNMSPVIVREDDRQYVIMHFMDVIGVEKNPFNLQI